jgi:hypothetical protein
MAIVLLWCSAATAQKLKYDVLLFGKKIGETTVEMKDSLGVRHYSLRSNTEVKMMFMDKKSEMSTDVLFGKDNLMKSSVFQNIKNDEKLSTKAIGDKDKLIVDKDGEKTTFPGAVKFSSLLLYFSEPTHLQRVFSERLGQFFEITKETDGKYKAETSSGTAIYTYLNGKLTDLEMKSSMGSIFLKLVN